MCKRLTRQSLWIVLVEADHWQLLRFHAGRCVEKHAMFAVNEPAGRLRSWLQHYPDIPVVFLTDLAEEHYHVEHFPPVTGATRRQLVMRKLSAWPAATGMQQAHYLGSVTGTRRQDAYLFSAVVSPALQACLQQLEQHQVRIRGVFTQLQCLPCWEHAVQSSGPYVLHIHQSRQRVRLTYLYQAQVWFSRVLSLSATEITTAQLASEILSTRAYLYNQQWLPAEVTLQLVWRCEDAAFVLHRHLNLPPDIGQVYVDQQPMAESGNILEDCSAMTAGAINTLLQGVALPNLAPLDWQWTDWVMQARQYLSRACLIMLCLGVVITCLTVLDRQLLQEQKMAVDLQSQRVGHQPPPSGIPDADLPKIKTLYDVVAHLEQVQSSPGSLLELLYAMPLPNPAWQLSRVQWQREAMHIHPAAEPALQHAPAMQNRPFGELEFIRQVSPNATAQWQALLTRLRTHPAVAQLDWQPDSLVEVSGKPQEAVNHQTVKQGSTQASIELSSPQQIYLELKERRQDAH